MLPSVHVLSLGRQKEPATLQPVRGRRLGPGRQLVALLLPKSSIVRVTREKELAHNAPSMNTVSYRRCRS